MKVEQNKLQSKKVLLLIAAVSILPVIGSYLLYNWWRPSAQMNHGELVTTKPVNMAGLVDVTTGKPLPGPGLKGKWVLLTVQSSACDERCRRKLYLMRQVRTATNENQDRIERVWLVDGPGEPNSKLLAEHPGLRVARTPDAALIKEFPAKGPTDTHIYLIDPLGNLVLRYDENFEPKGMLKDLGRLLKYSRIG